MQALETMCANDNRTVLDLQEYFQRFMPEANSPKIFNYCAPNSYTSSFITHAIYPRLLSYDEYKAILKRSEDLEYRKFLSNHKVNNLSDLNNELRQEFNITISKAVETCKKSLKNKYLRQAQRYINALRYYNELRDIKTDAHIKMYSTENIGWTTFNYPISEDIVFLMKSNFGYGNSSYHYVNLSYKGIDILPYSALVKYYHVDMLELYRYTRQYRPTHRNWEVALDFVVETANLAIQDEHAFISKWICNEIEEMVTGLKLISDNPKECLQDFFSRTNPDRKFLYVRNAYRADKDEFSTYPNEVSIVFKAEKLSAALTLLENLEKLAPTFSIAQDAIEKIKKINIQ